jgi:uncharacterized protein YPO0396
MALQDSARAIRNGERTLLARAAGSFAGAINENSKDFIAQFMAALGESRRCEAERIIRRYANLRSDLKP